MNFCDKCDNMMYISLRPGPGEEGGAEPGGEVQEAAESKKKGGGELQLTYTCKHCGFSTTSSGASGASGESPGGVLVMSTDYEDDQATYKQYATPYLKYDRTLPRASDIECVLGDQCTRPPSARREVIFVKYDAQRLKFLYHCVHCDSFWKGGRTTPL